MSPAAPRLVQRLGLALVLLGLVAGLGVGLVARSGEEGDAVSSQREMRELERLGGTAAVRTVEFDQWLGSLWHGERLGWTLAVLGLVVGSGCFWLGGLMAEEDLDG